MFFLLIIIAISLSMDTFSLSLSYGMLNIDRKKIFKVSLTVGLFHFFMPLLGSYCGNYIFSIIPVYEKTLIGIIFLTISVEIIFSLFKEKEISPINSFKDIILFSLAVSIDSFATGTCLDVFHYNYIFISIIFMVVSFLFTYFGLYFGFFLHKKIGIISEIIGIILLISLSFFYLIC